MFLHFSAFSFRQDRSLSCKNMTLMNKKRLLDHDGSDNGSRTILCVACTHGAIQSINETMASNGHTTRKPRFREHQTFSNSESRTYYLNHRSSLDYHLGGSSNSLSWGRTREHSTLVNAPPSHYSQTFNSQSFASFYSIDNNGRSLKLKLKLCMVAWFAC